CVTLSDTGWTAGTGMKRGVDLREIDEHSDLVVIWGGNPVNTQVNVMNHAMAANRRGASGARAWRIMHVLFREGFADWDYLRRYTDCPDDLAKHVSTRTPA